MRSAIGRLLERVRAPARRASVSGRLLESLGQVDWAGLEGADQLLLSGWVGSSRGGAQGFRVRCGGRELAMSEVAVGIASPEVAQFIPNAPHFERAGFRFRVALGAPGMQALRGQLIRITPIFDGRPGMDLLTVVDPLVPRPSVEEVSLVGENLNVAFEFLNYFIEFCGLWPAAAVLDVGCGVGRMAYGLAHVLNDEGSYEGFDIVERFIQVAAARFQSLANFRFHHVDVLNGLYNPGGKLIPSEFRFPYRDASFDLVVLASVFTHMRPEEVSHYLDEIRRVLRPGGKCLASVFLLERESKRLIACGRAPLPLRPVDGGFYAADPANPEWAIGHEEDAVLDALARRGFRSERILRGSWCGRSAFTSYQDVLIFGR